MALALNKARATWKERRVESKDIALQDTKSDTTTALPPAVPAPPYRHAAPSGPWPWMDLKNVGVSNATSDHNDIDKSWPGYPQNLFGNWTPDQVERSQMLKKCSKNLSSTIYWMDVLDTGSFTPGGSDIGNGHTSTVTSVNENEFWNILQAERPGNIRVRSLFVDDLSSPVLRMLGTRYNIEPFFFTSSINWIPSRYQEAPTHGEGDHITITLPFVRTLHSSSPSTSPTASQSKTQRSSHSSSAPREDIQINTQAPFPLRNGNMLFIDLLAIHMVRGAKTSTIISYHPDSTWCQTSAKRLHSLMLLVGGSVYWRNIFSKTQDPTFLFLTILWYALYAWDESFELLYSHVSKLESDVLQDSHLGLTRELHVLQAHLLHYQALLHNFKVSVIFIEKTPNPAMESKDFTDEQRETSNELMEKECENLLSEIDRLEKRREMLSSRLKNSMDLAFATVNIADSKQTRELTQATVRDSAAMKQISYLTMVFLPASFIASVFGMNVKEINPGSLGTVAHYVEVTISLTMLTAYIVITLQTHSSVHEVDAPLRIRAAWPGILLWKVIREKASLQPIKEKTVADMV
ncbi:hypothetical protein AZE42_07559 [Rhizopogon vesiculosus]|uniref:Uncharacterized protein n=1 Tax=Rhizopogon vesiculosus TaxID=180088 RepID=A0A1J8QTL9_9AGAM|nr:hypothetical protein AZE42_07559 [Rhizopogon vesiculosus]